MKPSFRYFLVYAHYNKHACPEKYVVVGTDKATPSQAKRWFRKTYPWLDVYKVEEISEEEARENRGNYQQPAGMSDA